MFAMPVLQISAKPQDGGAQMFSESIATFGLIGTIAATIRFRASSTAPFVGLYITSAYWFTASTTFANPAVTLARSLSDTFAGIAPRSMPGFLVGQLIGTLAACILFGWLVRDAE